MLSLQAHVPPDVYLAMSHLLNGPTNHYMAQAASGRQIVSFFDTIGDLVDASGAPQTH